MRLINLLLMAALAAPGAAAHAETGAAGWLRYARVRDVGQYRSIPAHVVALDRSPAIQSAAREAVRGLSGMLGRPFSQDSFSSTTPEIVIGTVAEIQSRFPDWKPVSALKPEGYVIAKSGTDWIVAGTDARGALYGT
ncbi:MAG: alpha-glucuronidase family glycosyl hydrolase, partial [Acidobacteriaceae bacterium]